MEQELHKAVIDNDADKIVNILATDPEIDVNQKDTAGNTAFALACMKNRLACAVVLLKEPRVKVGLPNKGGFPALFHLAIADYVDIVKWWIALRRESWLGCDKCTLMGITEAYYSHGNKVIRLLKSYMNDPVQTRFKVQLQLGLNYELATELFVLVVCVCDDLLKISKNSWHAEDIRAVKFFSIAVQLPMELQMLMCHRVFESTKQNIASSQIEITLRRLVNSGLIIPVLPSLPVDFNITIDAD